MIHADHEFEPYMGGRYPGSCSRCGRIPGVHPAPPPPEYVERDLAVEGLVVARAVTGTAIDPRAIQTFAAQRAHPGPILVRGRNFRREGAEELADGHNYGVWRVAYILEPAAAAGDQEAAALIPAQLSALRNIYAAWDDLHR